MSEQASTTFSDLISRRVLSIGDGYRTRRDQLSDSGYRILRVADINDGRISASGSDFVDESYEHAIGAKAARKNDVILTTKGTVGRVAVVPSVRDPLVYSPQICYFRIEDGFTVIPHYLAYWLKGSEFTTQSSHLQGNTDMAPYISLRDLRSTRISLPPIGRQIAVAEVLSALDGKIAANSELVNVSRSTAASYASSIAMRVPLSDLASLSKKTIDPTTLDGVQVAHFSLPAFDAGRLPMVETAAAIQSQKFVLDTSVVLLSKLNPRFPRVWNIGQLPVERALASTEFLVLVPKDVSTSLLWAALSQDAFSALLDAKVAGTSGSHQRVKPGDALATPVADVRLLSDSAARIVSGLVELADSLVLANRTLAALRDTLLPPLMSGKLRVRDAERAVSEVL